MRHQSRRIGAVVPAILLILATPGHLPAQPTSITLATSANPVVFGQPLTFTAAVLPATASGNVTFYDGVTVLGTRPLVTGKAALTTCLLPSGVRSIRAYYSGVTSAVLVQTVTALPGIGFGSPVKYNQAAYSLTAADFNGDGKADLVTANTGPSVSVLLGNGDGSFQPAKTYAVEAAPNQIAVGDFNGDGKSDMAVTNGSGVSVFLGEGDGTFQPRTTYPIAPYANSVAVADFDGDGKADLAVSAGGTLSILLGNGDGTFHSGSSYSALLGPTAMAVGDFNGDGFADLAITTNQKHRCDNYQYLSRHWTWDFFAANGFLLGSTIARFDRRLGF